MSEILYMSFDVESVGLHGEGFAVGYVIVDAQGRELDSGMYSAPVDTAMGRGDDRDWVTTNVVPALDKCFGRWGDGIGSKSPRDVRERFWQKWMGWYGRGVKLAAECAWPVEANFLNACIADDPANRASYGPYPLIDIASVRLAAGLDPLGTCPRRDDELPAHNPLADARQSARLLIEALERIGQPAL